MKTILLILLALSACAKKQGPDGPQGPPGVDAQPCFVASQPGSILIQCPDGSSQAIHSGIDGTKGSDGQEGAIGPQGAQGIQGLAGADGTQITVVALCPGTPSYPSIFLEDALCINNALYGVYSANGGFLTLLPPGTYSSNAIGATCSLTVRPHCQVTHD